MKKLPIRKKLADKLREVAAHVVFTLEGYLPRIEQKFAPSTEIYGELEDCAEAINDILGKINQEEKRKHLWQHI